MDGQGQKHRDKFAPASQTAPMARDHHYFVYMMASKPRGTIYTGVTNDVMRRASEHACGAGGAFTRKYGVNTLVWFEEHQYIDLAIAREKAIKKWRRAEKIALIEEGKSDVGEFGLDNLTFVIPAAFFRHSRPHLCHSRYSGNLFLSRGKSLHSCPTTTPTNINPLKGKMDSRCGGNDKGEDGEGMDGQSQKHRDKFAPASPHLPPHHLNQP